MATTDRDDLEKIVQRLLEDYGNTFYGTSDDSTELEDAINAAYYSLYNTAAILSEGGGPTISLTTLDIVSGTSTIALPSDFYRLTALWYKESENSTYPWKPINPGEQHEVRRNINRDSKQLRYYIRGSNLVVVPTPNYSATAKLNIEYVPEPTELALGTDEPVFPLNHRELIAYEAAKRLIQKEGISLGPEAASVHHDLRSNFERDMQSQQWQSSRRLNGNGEYHIYGEMTF